MSKFSMSWVHCAFCIVIIRVLSSSRKKTATLTNTIIMVMLVKRRMRKIRPWVPSHPILTELVCWQRLAHPVGAYISRVIYTPTCTPYRRPTKT